MMAPALSEALNICRPQPELGARDELEKKALALIHPRGLQLSVDKLPCSPPVAASPPPAVPSPPTSASSSVTKYKNGLALNNNHLNRLLTLDSSIFDTPATADTAPRHHSPLSPPLSPVEDYDAGEEEEGRKNIRLLPHPPPQTACDNMDILNLECHLPDSPSSQLSVVPTPNAVISCDNKPVEETMAFDIPQFPFPWDRTDAGDDATMRVDRIANRQASLARNYANVLDRVRRITVSCLCSQASRVAQRVTVSQHQSSVSTRRQKCPVSEEEPERTPKVEPSTAAECVKLMKKWEEDYGETSPGKRYINRLQSVAFVKEPKAQKRKPTSSAAFSLSLSTCSLKRSKFVELNADAKEELQTVFKQLHSQWRSLTSLDDGIDSCGEDDGEVTDSSSGGESCDEYEGFDSNRRNVGDRPDRKLPSIEKRASSRWLAETQSLSARWDWLQVNAENLRTASESLEHCRRELRLRKGAVFEDLSKSISRPASKATYYHSSHLNANSNLSNADLRPQDGKPPSELPPSGGNGSQNFRKNGYLFNNPSSSSTPPSLPSSSSTSTSGQRPETDFRTTRESVVDESDVEESTQAETCSRLMPLAASFRKRRLLRVPPATARHQTSPANVPKGLADLDEPVLAASRIHQAIHPVLSSMKDVPLSTHVDSLLLLQSRAEREPEEEDEDEEEPEEDYVDSRKKIPRKDDLVEEVRTNGKASSIASSSSSTSSRLRDRDRDRDRDWDPEREDKDKPKFHRTKDGRFARVDSAASSPSRASSRSRGQKRPRADSHSSDSKRHRRRRRDRHYESSSSSSRKSRHHSSTRSQPNSSREGSPALGGGGSSSRSRAERLSTSSASAAANRKAYLQKNYDINSVVIPTYSLYTDLPKRKEYKNIPTPAWKKVNRSVTAAVSTGWLDISRPTTSFRTTHEPAVMRDELFAVLHFDSESKEKHSMKLPQDSSGGRNRQRKNTLNVPSGQGTPARATSPMSVDQSSDAGGIYSPSCSSPPPTPRSVDTNSSVGVNDGYSNPTSRTVNGQRRHNNPAPSSSTSSSSAAARHAGRDEPSIFDDEESSMYYDRRHFPLSDAEFATLLDDVLGVQPPTTPQGVGAARQATGPIKWEDGPNLSESSDDDSDDEMSDDDESWEEQSKPKNKPQQRSDAPARTSVATSNR